MSWAPSNATEAVRFFFLDALPPPAMTESGVRVTTHCMYPSNGLVRVYVKGGKEHAIVSDEGEAVGEVLAAGVEVENIEKLVRHVVSEQGLTISAGIIRSRVIPYEALPAAIPLVANAARDVASLLYDHKKTQRPCEEADRFRLNRGVAKPSNVNAYSAGIRRWNECYRSLWELKLAFEKEHNRGIR